MEEPSNKTIICSVFFLDIIEYSKKSVSAQISLKERFNAFLSIAIRDVPVGDRIILDTGDGAAISFLGDISDALHAALSMRSNSRSSCRIRFRRSVDGAEASGSIVCAALGRDSAFILSRAPAIV